MDTYVIVIVMNGAYIFTVYKWVYWNFIYAVLCRNLRDDAKGVRHNYGEPLELHDEVLRCNPEAFECSAAGNQSCWFLLSTLNTTFVNLFKL